VNPRARRRTVAVVAALVAVPAAAVIWSQGAAGSPASSPAQAPVPAADAPAAQSFRSVRGYQQVAVPVRLRIPAAHVDTPLDRLGRAADGTVEVPSDFATAGWFQDGPRPGQPGPAVVLGHVDSKRGPAVFSRLPELVAGAEVFVDRADGSTAAFRVTATQRVPKAAFPTDLVYGPTLEPSLRLVTCGGTFDRATGSYRDNVIVYADLVQ
jgi:sortase (surface protein transpeptidase)